jgi:hypothetical protein
MRRITKLSVLCLAAGVVGACRPDEVIRTEDIPTAGVRFINAVPDTMPLDFRFIDLVENSAHFRITFRNSPSTTANVTSATSLQYKPARAGTRSYRVFLNDTIQSVASTVLEEGTLTLEAGHNYTVVMWGYANPGGPNRPANAQPMRLDVIDETVADPSPNVALRVVNTTMDAIDGTPFAVGTTPGAVPAAFNDIPAMSASAYVTMPPDTILMRIQPAAGGASLFADSRALVGAPAVVIAPGPFDALPGTTIAGSAVSAIVFPGSVACSLAPQASPFQFTTGSTTILTATATGYARPSGSFVTDGITVGMTVGACGFTQPENNGLSTVTAVTATSLTVTKPGGTLLEAGTTGNQVGVISATPTGYSRTTGSFITNGFVVGMQVTASGFTTPANNGVSTVTGVTATTLTVTKTPATTLEAATTGSTSLGASATGYTRSTGSFVADGWVVGQPITASGFADPANNGNSTVTAVTATDLTVSRPVGTTVPEAEAAGRTISSSANRAIANATLRQIAAQRPFIVFNWDRRPPRPAGT